MFIELMLRIFTLDIPWLISLVLNNLFWVFGFIALMHFFMGGKKVIYSTIILTLVLFAVHDFELVANVVVIGPSFLLFHFIGKLAVHIIAENSKTLKKYHLLLTNLELVVVFFLCNIFILV